MCGAVLESWAVGNSGTPGRDLGTRARQGCDGEDWGRGGGDESWSSGLSGTREFRDGIWEFRNVPEFRSPEDRGIVGLGCGIPELCWNSRIPESPSSRSILEFRNLNQNSGTSEYGNFQVPNLGTWELGRRKSSRIPGNSVGGIPPQNLGTRAPGDADPTEASLWIPMLPGR